MSDLDNTTPVVSGTVKWFDPAKGFGFVVSDDGGADILLHVNVLRNYGQSSIADGARVEITAHETSRGVQATQVHAIHPPQTGQSGPLEEIVGVDPAIVNAAPIEPARVKWFDKSKGFGFANVFGKSADIFLHVEVLRQSGLSDVQPGEALALRVIAGERGKMAAEVYAWETVILSDSDAE
ncbi:cold-shock DNA-binding protein family [Sulfitobacter marinus]|uniref:Cold-shock DNA-binding protein family n=1 Tax=Sulfitobacter marinus TaxID=394264 RepID=A0A1I6SET0_9RHOB|nr:cold shock domain-containing protein [Sulfitobacter marinus]SFS75471.1 cold-shock DNA-binding protein family [Sulfitobacter marinus]